VGGNANDFKTVESSERKNNLTLVKDILFNNLK